MGSCVCNTQRNLGVSVFTFHIEIVSALVTELLSSVCREWAAKMQQEKPDYFSSLAGGQAPEYFWIGCADSRVPVRFLQ